MLFLVHFEITPEHRNAALERFDTIQRGWEAEDITTIGIWFSVTQLEVWCVVEATQAEPLASAFHSWTDLNTCEITPIIEKNDFLKFIRNV